MDLLETVKNHSQTIEVITFYKFVDLENPNILQKNLLELCKNNNVLGTIYLADEGINATITGNSSDLAVVENFLNADGRFADMDIKISASPFMPFSKMKVKVRPEIVTIGLPEVRPLNEVGTYVSPKDWNNLISDPKTVVIDTRNEFEFEVGTFEGSLNPKTKTFKDFPGFVDDNLDPQVNKKVAMFCTGGIRCEKASSYLKSQGFDEVFHLEGGILNYLDAMPEEKSKWQGECFVFDDRVTINSDFSIGNRVRCEGCGYPLSKDEAKGEYYSLEEEYCPHCFQG